MNCLIVDDEPLARDIIQNHLEQINQLNLVGLCENALQAQTMIQNHAIDLLFLDINMPRLSGLDLLKSLKNPPICIITTAYPQYALDGFNLDVTDYLLKPISFERFFKAVNKAQDFFDLRVKAKLAKTENAADYFYVKCDKVYEKVSFMELLLVESLDNYVLLHLAGGKRLVSYLTLKIVEEYLPQTQFMKVHKSFIVNINKIDKIETSSLRLEKHEVAIARNLKDQVMEKLLNNRFLKR